MSNLKSIILFFQIEILRSIDQFKRRHTGLPVLKTSQITDQLFVGGQYKEHLSAKLQALGITAVVNMQEIRLKDVAGLNYLHLPTSDRQAPTLENLDKGVKFIQKQIDQNGKVYIHCKAGEGRGPSMAIAYLIFRGMTFENAFATIKKVRRFIRPTQSQITQLRKFASLQKE